MALQGEPEMKVGIIFGYKVALLLLYAGLAVSEERRYGDISFPNSGAGEAQSAFLTGVGLLHSFEFGPARIAFEEAQEIDPSFALAYWGQAMTDNHPLWAEQDVEAPTAALNKLAPDFKGRLNKAPTEKEKAYITAVETLYFSHDDKLQRDLAYAEHMERMHERWPDDDEIAIFYALSLLGTVRRGDKGFRRQALAAYICQEIFSKNENHPGALHFIIHSFDDPDHAILALPAAKIYARIAPDAGHAVHMPSHIFLQLGMWQEVINSNIRAYDVLFATNEKYGLPEGHEEFHALFWLAHANLMLGHLDRANENLGRALAAVERNPGDERVLGGYLRMRARNMIETGQWQDVELDAPDSVAGKYVHWVAAIGMSAAHRRDRETAAAVIDRLESLGKQAAADSKNYEAMQIAIIQKEVAAISNLLSGDKLRAIDMAREAAEMQMREMSAPSGPPMPMKPAIELYGDILLAADRPAEALDAYERSLQWMPYRTPSMLGLAKAASAAGDKETADEMFARVRKMPGVNPAIK
jgi:tetratricopeptide (TPR) repeat protein